MKEIQTSKGTFIVVPGYKILEYCESPYELIGLVSEILKDEELSKKVVDSSRWHWPMEHDVFMNYEEPLKEPNKVSGEWRQEWNVSFGHATDSFQSLCTKYELKPTDLIIKKL